MDRQAGTGKEGAAAARSRAMLLAAMLVFGTVGLFIRSISLPSAEIALYRAVGALLVLSLILAFTGRFGTLYAQRAKMPRAFVTGAVMAFNWILLFEAYRYTSIAMATLAYYLAPTLMVVAGVVLMKERLSGFQVLCFVMSTLGLVLMLGVSLGAPGDLRGILLGLASAVLYATVVTVNRLSGETDGLVRTFVQFLGAVAVMLPFVALSGGFHLHTLNPSGWGYLLTLGIVHTGLCYSLYFQAITHLKGQQVAVLSYLDPLTAVMLSVFLLGEKVNPWQLWGGGLMLLFALLNELSHSRQGRKVLPVD